MEILASSQSYYFKELSVMSKSIDARLRLASLHDCFAQRACSKRSIGHEASQTCIGCKSCCPGDLIAWLAESLRGMLTGVSCQLIVVLMGALKHLR
jgi:hypothetical protein